MADIVVVGSVMTDLTSYVSRLPNIGETVHGDSFSIGFGGKGANQCVLAAKLGAKTAMVAKIGCDIFGKNTLNNFAENDVNVEYMKVTDLAATGVATISVAKDGDNAIVIVAGANYLLTEEEVNEAESLIGSAAIVVCQLEIRPSVTLAALKTARKHNVKTILNPTPALANLSQEFYDNTTVLCLNESEAELMTGRPVKSSQEAHQAVKDLVDRGCSIVILTRGSRGCLLMSPDHLEPVDVPTKVVDVVDGTGAGDAFIGSLAYFMTTRPDMNMFEVCRRANEIASLSVTKRGTQTSYSRRDDLTSELFA